MSAFIKPAIYKNLQEILWPIHKSEIKLFIPLGVMMLCILFNFGALRSIKDSLVVPNIGPEVISFLKLWLVFPATILFTIIYIKLSNIFDSEHLFYLIVTVFLVFFALFAYVLFPAQEQFHPCKETVTLLHATYPNLKWFIKIIDKWSYALMYVFCELWSVVVINLLFWQYANYIFDTESAKRFYPFLGVIGNLGLILAGNMLVNFSDLSGVTDCDNGIHYGNNIDLQCEIVLKPIINFVIFVGILAMVLYAYINRYVLKATPIKIKYNSTKTKTSLSFMESMKLLVRSKYIGHIALLVIGYGFLINILEGPWKAKVRDLYPNTIDYINFMGKFNIWMGVSCVIFMVIGSNVLRKFSWLTSALITPYMIKVTGVFFFCFVIVANEMPIFDDWFNPIYVAVIIGAAQNILSKSTKYSLFDSTKEMAYIPLPLELKTKGKAAVEVIGLKFGKSLGALMQSFMFMLMPMASFDSLAVYMLTIFIIIVVLWIWNIKSLGKEYIMLRSK